MKSASQLISLAKTSPGHKLSHITF